MPTSKAKRPELSCIPQMYICASTRLASIDMRDKRDGVCLYLKGPDAESHYQLLRDQREEIESALKMPLEWETADEWWDSLPKDSKWDPR